MSFIIDIVLSVTETLIDLVAESSNTRIRTRINGKIINTLMMDPSGLFAYPTSPYFVPEEVKVDNENTYVFPGAAEAIEVRSKRGKFIRYECTDPRLQKAGVDPRDKRAPSAM